MVEKALLDKTAVLVRPNKLACLCIESMDVNTFGGENAGGEVDDSISQDRASTPASEKSRVRFPEAWAPYDPVELR